MGLEDRQYYRDDGQGGLAATFGNYSIITRIIIINVAIVVIDAFTPEVPGTGAAHWLSYFMGIKYDQPWALWTYFTYGFAHASISTQTGIMHVAFNMLNLWLLGQHVERRLGRSEFLKFYLIAIVVSGVGFMLIRSAFYPVSPGYVVGASGAVSAVLMLFVFMFWQERVSLFGILPMPAWVLGILLIALDLRHAFTPGSPVAWQAHMVGAAFGAIYFLRRWNFNRLNIPSMQNLLKSKPNLKVHNPQGVDEKLKSQADAILQKISEQGEESLTSRERKTLNKYSEQIRKHRQ